MMNYSNVTYTMLAEIPKIFIRRVIFRRNNTSLSSYVEAEGSPVTEQFFYTFYVYRRIYEDGGSAKMTRESKQESMIIW